MYQIQNLTNNARQKQTLVLPDGTFITLEIYFIEMQQGWFITNLQYGNFTLSGLRITNSPNMLYQFKNQIPFGIACFSSAEREPSLVDDFASQSSKLYVLTQAEVEQYSEYLSGQI